MEQSTRGTPPPEIVEAPGVDGPEASSAKNHTKASPTAYQICPNEGNRTHVPNEIIDLAFTLRGAEKDVLLLLARYTIGWHGYQGGKHHYTETNLAYSDISAALGVGERAVIKAIKSLVDKQVVIITNCGGGRTPNRYALNYNRSSWLVDVPSVTPNQSHYTDCLRSSAPEIRAQNSTSDPNGGGRGDLEVGGSSDLQIRAKSTRDLVASSVEPEERHLKIVKDKIHPPTPQETNEDAAKEDRGRCVDLLDFKKNQEARETARAIETTLTESFFGGRAPRKLRSHCESLVQRYAGKLDKIDENIRIAIKLATVDNTRGISPPRQLQIIFEEIEHGIKGYLGSEWIGRYMFTNIASEFYSVCGAPRSNLERCITLGKRYHSDISLLGQRFDEVLNRAKAQKRQTGKSPSYPWVLLEEVDNLMKHPPLKNYWANPDERRRNPA